MDLTEFEKAVYGRQHRAAVDLLSRVLQSVARGELQVAADTEVPAQPAYQGGTLHAVGGGRSRPCSRTRT